MTRPFPWAKALHIASLVIAFIAVIFTFLDYEGLDAAAWNLAWILGFWAAGLAIDKLNDIDGADALQGRVNALEAALIQERTDSLWDAYNTGFTKDGQWCHAFMSDGEWLAAECGLDPTQGWYDDAEVLNRIPEAALT